VRLKELLDVNLRPKTTLIIGSILPTLFLLKFGLDEWNFPDAGLFIEQAKALNQGISYMKTNADELERPFGLPLVIAFGFKIFDTESVAFARVVLLAFHLGTLTIIYKIMKKLKINPKIQAIAILGYSLDPFVLSQTLDLQTEPITAFFASWWCLLAISELNSKLQRMIVPIIFFTSGFFAIATRPNLVFPFLGIAIFLSLKWRECSTTKNSSILGAFSFVSLITVFHIFLYKIFMSFVILAPNSGPNFALACRKEFVPQYLGIASNSQNMEINRWYIGYLGDLVGNLQKVGKSFDYGEISKIYTQAGIENCIRNPLETFWILLLKVFSLWRPSTVFGAYNLNVFLVSILVWIPLTYFVIRFMVSPPINEDLRNLRVFLFIFWGLFTISLLPSATQIRHRVAAAEQFYWIIMAIYLNSRLGKKNV
jgi:hypothetical protein